MKNLNFPIGQPSIDIKIDNINGVTNFKWYRAKIVGMGGLTPAYFSPIPMLSGMGGGLRSDSDILATGLTTPEKIVEADAEKDYKLLAFGLRCTLITVETLNKILSGERAVWNLSADAVKEPVPGVEYRVVDCYLSDQQKLYDLDHPDGGRTLIDTPFIIRKEWMHWLLDCHAYDQSKIKAAWEKITGGENGLPIGGPPSDPYAIWKPENAAEIREQVAGRVSDWIKEHDPFGIKELIGDATPASAA